MTSTVSSPGSLLRGLDSSTLSDALDRLGVPGAMHGFLRWGPGRPVSGRARTVSLEPAEGRTSGPHLGARVIESVRPGEVIVVANAGRVDAGSWGGLLTLAAGQRGVAGIIVDGAVRDVDEVDGLGVPVFGLAATCRTARGRYREAGSDVPVTVDGVKVEPGSWVVADGSGVVVVNRDRMPRAAEVARALMESETEMLEALRAGAPVSEVLSVRYERMLEEGG